MSSSRLPATDVIELIRSLPDTDQITTGDKTAIEAARAAYETLTADQKKLVGTTMLQKLTDAEDRLAILQAMSEVSAKTGSGMNYTGNPIQLINTPTTALPAGCTMKYAVTTENKAPTNEYLNTTSIPSKIDAGTYYVWYKAVGDSHHIVTEPKSVKVVIAKATPRYTTPWGLTALTGQKLTDVKLPAGWSWVNSNEDVGEESINPFKANFTPSDTDNYETVRNVVVSVKLIPYTDGLIPDSDGAWVYD